jgi:hypothetical protein
MNYTHAQLWHIKAHAFRSLAVLKRFLAAVDFCLGGTWHVCEWTWPALFSIYFSFHASITNNWESWTYSSNLLFCFSNGRVFKEQFVAKVELFLWVFNTVVSITERAAGSCFFQRSKWEVISLLILIYRDDNN